jgi:RNA polymerase sigma factor (sigma-70 family)
MSSRLVTNGGDWAEMVRHALDGNEEAWRGIVDGLSGVVWKVLSSYSLDPADREEAFASTFFRLYQKLDTVRDPTRLPSWVATAARNEANSIWRSRQRTVPTDELPLRELTVDTIDEQLLDTELLQNVMNAFGTLPADGQALLRLLTSVPPLSYNEIADLLDMPKGSIGPTAGRHLTQLRRLLNSYNSGDPT